jgi:hypothetical protein
MLRTLVRAAAIAALLGVPDPTLAATDTSSEITAWKERADIASTLAESGEQGQAVEIVVLFRSDCAPCRHELDILPGIAAHFPDLLVTLLVLRDDGLLARQGDGLPAANLRIRKAEGQDLEMMARYGDDRRALPFSAALDAKGRICGRHFGLLGLKTVGQWREAC